MKLHPKEFLAAKLTDLHTRYILYWALPVNLCSIHIHSTKSY